MKKPSAVRTGLAFGAVYAIAALVAFVVYVMQNSGSVATNNDVTISGLIMFIVGLCICYLAGRNAKRGSGKVGKASLAGAVTAFLGITIHGIAIIVWFVFLPLSAFSTPLQDLSPSDVSRLREDYIFWEVLGVLAAMLLATAVGTAVGALAGLITRNSANFQKESKQAAPERRDRPRDLYVVALILIVPTAITWLFAYFSAVGPDGEATNGGDPIVALAAVALSYTVMLLGTIACVGYMVKAAQSGQWVWFLLMFTCISVNIVGLSPLAITTIYLIASSKGLTLRTPALPGQTSNPFHSGQRLFTGDSSAAGGYANWVDRASAGLIDLATLFVALAATLYFFGVLFWYPTLAALANGDQNAAVALYAISFAFLWIIMNACFWVVTLLFILIVWPVQWSRSGQTYGQRAMNIKVMPEQGTRISFWRALLRSILVFSIDILVLGIPVGWLWSIFDPKGQAWHDKLAGTVVIGVTSSSRISGFDITGT